MVYKAMGLLMKKRHGKKNNLVFFCARKQYVGIESIKLFLLVRSLEGKYKFKNKIVVGKLCWINLFAILFLGKVFEMIKSNPNSEFHENMI